MIEATSEKADYQPSEAIWAALVVSAMDAIIVIDEQQRIVLFNPAAEKMFRCRAEKVLGQPLDRFIPERFRTAHGDHVRHFGEGRPTSRQMGSDYYLPALRADGEEFPIELSISVSTTGGKKLYTAIVRDVTERLRTEAALRQSEAEFRIMFELTSVGMGQVDPANGRFLRVNPKYCEITGYSADELRNMTFAQVTHPEDQEADFALFQRVVRGEQPEYFAEKRYVRKDGRLIWVQVNAVVIRDAQGKPLRTVAVVYDITERKRAEEERHKFVSLAENSLEFVGMCDRAFKPFYVNPAGMRMVGLENLEAACGVRVQDYFFPEDQPFITNEFFPQVVREGHAEVEIPFRHFQTGEAIWMLYNVFNIHDSAGAAVGWATVSRNIHDRKRTEAALRQSEAEFRLAFENAQDAIIWANAETGVLVNCNKAAEELLERTREEIVGQHQTILHPPEKTEAYARMFHEHVEKKHIDEEATIVTKSGKTKVVQIRAAVTLIGDKPIIQGIFHDITQRKLAEEQLRASLHEKEVLLREVHHRVKNNLAIIDSFLSLQANKCQDAVATEGLRDCQNRLRSMAFIHDRLYQVDDLAFIDFGGYITSLCHHLFQSYGVDPRRIHLRLDLGEFFLSLEVAMPLGLLLNELLTNIIKYAFPEGRGGEVSVQLQTLGEGLAHLVVSDNGVGLPLDVNVQRPQSVGLRLVQILARQIGGTLEFHRHGGTTVRLAFPSALSGAKHAAEQKLQNKSPDRRG